MIPAIFANLMEVPNYLTKRRQCADGRIGFVLSISRGQNYKHRVIADTLKASLLPQ